MTTPVQRFNDERAARYLRPDDALILFNGRHFQRNHPKVCPTCGTVFYAYKPVDAVWPPHCVDPEPMPGNQCGVRETCGHPHCEKAEDEHQFQRRKAWRESGRA